MLTPPRGQHQLLSRAHGAPHGHGVPPPPRPRTLDHPPLKHAHSSLLRMLPPALSLSPCPPWGSLPPVPGRPPDLHPLSSSLTLCPVLDCPARDSHTLLRNRQGLVQMGGRLGPWTGTERCITHRTNRHPGIFHRSRWLALETSHKRGHAGSTPTLPGLLGPSLHIPPCPSPPAAPLFQDHLGRSSARAALL